MPIKIVFLLGYVSLLRSWDSFRYRWVYERSAPTELSPRSHSPPRHTLRRYALAAFFFCLGLVRGGFGVDC